MTQYDRMLAGTVHTEFTPAYDAFSYLYLELTILEVQLLKSATEVPECSPY